MISVLIPTYNQNIGQLVKTLNEAVQDSNEPFEVIVYDDGSTQQDIMSSNAYHINNYNFKHIIGSVNIGRTQARKKLAETAKYDFLLFLDADVIPQKKDFIQNYLENTQPNTKVICGGCAYQNKKPENDKTLRWTYGKGREEKPAKIRNKSPYQFIFSGNLFIEKNLFLKVNFDENRNIYGMDIFMAYQLFQRNIQIKHIDNFVLHLGLESNEVFLKKSLESTLNRYQILYGQKQIIKLNPMLKYFSWIQDMKLTSIKAGLFRYFEKLMRKNLLGKHPSLFIFDLYRLGYLCLNFDNELKK